MIEFNQIDMVSDLIKLPLGLLTSDLFLTAYKIAAPIGAGISAIVGLSSKFRNEITGRLTKVGVGSIVGIVLSIVVGVIAGAIERDKDQAAERAQLQQLHELQRAVTPIGNPDFVVTFRISEEDFYQLLKSHSIEFNKDLKGEKKDKIIEDLGDQLIEKSRQFLSVTFVASDYKKQEDLRNVLREAPLKWISAKSKPEDGYARWESNGSSNFVEINIEVKNSEIYGDGSLQSWLDLVGKKVVVSCIPGGSARREKNLCRSMHFDKLVIKGSKSISIGKDDCDERILSGYLTLNVCKYTDRVERLLFEETMLDLDCSERQLAYSTEHLDRELEVVMKLIDQPMSDEEYEKLSKRLDEIATGNDAGYKAIKCL